MVPQWCGERILIVVAYRKSFFGLGLLELYRTSPWLRCEKHCLPGGKCTFLRNASMPRCSYAKPAFIKNRCRFGSFLELQSGLEMALASNRQWNGSINRFWNAFGSHFAPHLGPIGLHLGFGWASLGPILATPGPHWAPLAPNFDPIGAQLRVPQSRRHERPKSSRLQHSNPGGASAVVLAHRWLKA